MKRIARRAAILLLLAVFFLACTGFFLQQYFTKASIWVTHPANRNAYSDGKFINDGKVYSSDGTILYSSSGYGGNAVTRMSMLHSVGDMAGNINTGVISQYKSTLMGYDLINGLYNPAHNGGTVTLTIDADTCRAAYESLGGKNGTVGIYNYETGEIICMVSKPTYDPLKEHDFTNEKYKGVFVNGLTNGLYTPGSVFKLITSSAAIETIADINTRTFICKGGIEIDGEWVKCAGKHGEITFKQALAKSCNAAFAVISKELGAQTLKDYAERAGVGKSYSVSGIDSTRGIFRPEKAQGVELAWAGIGQYTNLVNPLQYMVFMGAIARGGHSVTPYYVERVETSYGLPSLLSKSSKTSRLLTKPTAEKLKELMRNNVTSEYGESGFKDMMLCAKTGTAEVSGGKAPHAWFTGFLDNPDTPLAFVVVVENGGGGAAVAIPVARKALQQAVKTFDAD